MSTSIPSVDQLKRAIKIAEQIQSLQTELASILGSSSASRATPVKAAAAAKEPSAPRAKRKYNFSAEARAKIAAAQKARWARQKKVAGAQK